MNVSNHPGSAGRIEFHVSHKLAEAPRSFWLAPGQDVNIVNRIPDDELIISLNAPNISGRSLYTLEIGVDDIADIKANLNEIWNITKSKKVRDLINDIEVHLSNARI